MGEKFLAEFGRRRTAPRIRRTSATVNVVITCYNYGRFLEAAAASVLSQTGVEPRLVIVDDGSSDDSVEVASRIVSRDSRATLIRNPTNLGPVGAFNRGLQEVTGDHVVRLDADDLLTEGSLARAVAVFDTYPEVGMVYGAVREFEGEPPATAQPDTRAVWTYTSSGWLRRRCRTGTNSITSPEVVLRRWVVDRIGGMDPRLAHAHDMEWWLRAAAVADVAWIEGPFQALHREHPNSRFRNMMAGRFANVEERVLAFDAFFSSDVGRSYAAFAPTARMTLAKEALEIAARDYDRGRTPSPSEEECRRLAVTTSPSVTGTLAWRALNVRRRLGRKLTPTVPLFWAGMVRRRVRDDLGRTRWRRTGV